MAPGGTGDEPVLVACGCHDGVLVALAEALLLLFVFLPVLAVLAFDPAPLFTWLVFAVSFPAATV